MRYFIFIGLLWTTLSTRIFWWMLFDKSVQKITEKALQEIAEKLAEKETLCPEEIGIAKKDLTDTPIEEVPFEPAMKAFGNVRYRWEDCSAINTVSRVIQQNCKTLFGDEKKCEDLHVAQNEYHPVWKNWQNILKWYQFVGEIK